MGVEYLLEASCFSGSNDIPCILLFLNSHCCLRETPPFGPVLSQINPFNPLPSCKIHFNIIFQNMS